MKKKSLLIVLAASLLLSVSACGGAGEQADNQESLAAGNAQGEYIMFENSIEATSICEFKFYLDPYYKNDNPEKVADYTEADLQEIGCGAAGIPFDFSRQINIGGVDYYYLSPFVGMDYGQICRMDAFEVTGGSVSSDSDFTGGFSTDFSDGFSTGFSGDFSTDLGTGFVPDENATEASPQE